jgi:site-specific DNA-methyltransferase (adenine-specific)
MPRDREVLHRHSDGQFRPFYEDEAVTIYLGDCREVMPALDLSGLDLVLTDPPYPNNAGHFDEGIPAVAGALNLLASITRHIVFWHQLGTPPAPRRLVAHHIWHRTNTNRPDNYEAIYEYADEPERPSKVFPFPVVYPGLTGCVEATGHPTQKPLKLMQSLIQLRKSTAVIDPFMGSGTTVEAAKRLGVKAIGIDINEEFCDMAARRLAQGVLDVA